MELGSFKTYRKLATVLWLLVGSFQLWQVRHAPIGDFANYYFASQALSEGVLEEAQLYEPYTFNLWVNDRAPTSVYVNYAPVPPISVLAYLPIAQISDIYQAKLVFNVLGLLFFAFVFWRGSAIWNSSFVCACAIWCVAIQERCKNSLAMGPCVPE